MLGTPNGMPSTAAEGVGNDAEGVGNDYVMTESSLESSQARFPAGTEPERCSGGRI